MRENTLASESRQTAKKNAEGDEEGGSFGAGGLGDRCCHWAIRAKGRETVELFTRGWRPDLVLEIDDISRLLLEEPEVSNFVRTVDISLA